MVYMVELRRTGWEKINRKGLESIGNCRGEYERYVLVTLNGFSYET